MEEICRDVIEEVASFPNGDHDDYCDSMTMAIMRFRQGGLYHWMEKTKAKTGIKKKGILMVVKKV